MMEGSVNVACVARITPPSESREGGHRHVGNKNDMDIQGKKLLLLPPSSSESEHEGTFDFIYELESTDEDIYHRSIEPLIRERLMEGYSVCIAVMGSSRSMKTETLGGKRIEKEHQGAGGLFAYIVNGLYDALNKNHDSKHFSVSISAYEIFKEVINDLLSQSQRTISLTYKDTFGLSPSNLECINGVQTMGEASSCFQRAWRRRNGTSTDFGPAIDFSSFVFNVDVTITRRANVLVSNNVTAETLRSRLMLVEIPSTDRLKDDPSVLRLREGSALNNSLINLNIVSKSLKNISTNDTTYTPYRSSKLTQVLHEALGGNMYSLVLAVVSPGQFHETKQAMLLANNLSGVQNYPICNSATTVGLLSRYRSEIQNLFGEAGDPSNSKLMGESKDGADGEYQEELQAKVHDLEGKVVRTNLDRLKIQEDHDKVFEKLSQFRVQFSTLVDKNQSLQMDLIKSEEEKLKVSKALLDTKIGHQTLMEKAEQEKYELVTRLLNAENDIMELELREQTREETSKDLKDKLDQENEKRVEHGAQVVTLKEAVDVKDKEISYLKKENQTSNEAILTLKNQKDWFEREVRTLEATKMENAKNLKEEKARADNLAKENFDLKTAIEQEKASANDLRMEVAKLNLDNKSTQVKFDQTKAQDEQKLNRLQRDRDKEVDTLRETQDTELQRYQSERKKLQENLSNNGIEKRKLQRELDETSSNLQKERLRIQELEIENKNLTDKLELEQNVKNNKLIELLDVAYSDQDSGEMGSKMQEIRKEFINTFQSKEKDYTDTIEKLRGDVSGLTQTNRVMREKFIQMRNELEDNLPNSTILTELPNEKDLKVKTETELEETLKLELEAIRRKLQERSSELSLQQEKNLQIGETYKKNVSALEKKSSQLLSENALLKHEKERLIKEAEHSAVSKGTADPVTLRKMEELQSTILKQMEDLKIAPSQGLHEQPSGHVDGVAGISSKEKEQLNRRISQLESENEKLKRKMVQEKNRKANISERSQAGEQAINDLQEENADLKKKLHEALSGSFGESGLLHSLEAAERKNAQLRTDKTVLEEELAQYKSFMSKEISKYKAQVQKLKQELKKGK